MPDGGGTAFDVEDILAKLTVDEKIALLSGIVVLCVPDEENAHKQFTGIDFWHTAPVSRLNVKSIRLTDGPNGIRGTRFFNGVPAACFPCVCLSHNVSFTMHSGY